MNNDIERLQSCAKNKLLLRARYRNYQAAKFMQGIFVSLSIVLPIAGFSASRICPSMSPYIALLGLILLILENALVDRFQKYRLRRGAKLQEQFDTGVFRLPWNQFIAGDRVEPEDVSALSAKPLSSAREKCFDSWYEPCVSELPLYLGRLVCQRTNLTYDARLRRTYGNAILFLTISSGIILLIVGIARDFRLSELVMTLIIPFMPIMTWALKEQRQHIDTAATLEGLTAEWKKIWNRALASEDEHTLDTLSRGLQDAIYQHRVRSPLVFDWVYNFLRQKSEDIARHAAGQMVEDAKEALRRSAA